MGIKGLTVTISDATALLWKDESETERFIDYNAQRV